jgi:hypothetical protein
MKIIDINGSEREVKSAAPDPTYPGFMKVEFRRHHEWYSIKEFLQFNPTLSSLTNSAAPEAPDVVGVLTSATKTSLSDSSQDWDDNIYAGYFVWISRGKGEGQKRTILKNNKSKLTLDKAWDTIPNKTSQYVVSQNIHEVKSFGNSLPSEDMKALEKRSIEMDKQSGRLNSHDLKKNIKYLDPDEI